MEIENLTKLTKGIIHLEANLRVPKLFYSIYDDSSFITQYQYKICRYVGTSIRVFGTFDNYELALSKLKYWRDWYKTKDIFLVKVTVELHKIDV